MLIELLFNIIFLPIEGLLSAFSAVSLPLDLITVLSNITSYGCWVLGSDLFILFITLVFSFYALRLSVGVAEWLWHLLPFC